MSISTGDDGQPPQPDHEGLGQGARPSTGQDAPEPSEPPSESLAAAERPQERRQFPRIQLALTVTLRFPSAEAAQESKTVDISEGGVFICMANPRAEGTLIQLCVYVGDRRLEIGGVVVRCVRPGEGGPAGIGVLFTDLRPDDAAFVRTLVRESLSQ